MIVATLQKSHRKHNEFSLIPLQNWIIFVFLFNFQAFYALVTLEWHQSFKEKQLMAMMMREERCVNNGLLLEGKKKRPLNLLQRLRFDHFEEVKAS
jgi:hypothetical protein